MTYTSLKRTGLILVIIGLLLANPYVIIPGMLLLLVSLLSWFWAIYLLKSLSCTFTLNAHRAQVGDQVQGELIIKNHQPFPIPHLTCSLDWPQELGLPKSTLSPHYLLNRSFFSNTVSLFWFQQVKKPVEIVCQKRGEFFFGPIDLDTSDLFGITTGRKKIPLEENLIIYPRIVDISFPPLPNKSPFGEEEKRSWIFEDPARFKGIREYRKGDPFSRIQWKATAKTNRLQSLLLDASTNRQMALVINTSTGDYPWLIDRELLERTIMTGASLAARCCHVKHRFGIYLNGLVRGSRVPASVGMGTGERQLLACMEVLGRIIPTANIPCEKILKAAGDRLGDVSQIFFITGKMNAALQSEIRRQLQRGRLITVIYTRHQPEELPLVQASAYYIKEEETWDALAKITLTPMGH